eukprot:CAMPEP_0198686576 /NCGR_PEP_ID=MMETSP1468-20131203/15078_1 /TAXON_ID=1461545 /ORGANISM="Mantoniella sp, Strain CCMP1436" /LENGTH=74 /DNA_ID=CAMNT_0044432771 /DNA_START=673 /DNA_END=893 /DNA_ORIENTATION=-
MPPSIAHVAVAAHTSEYALFVPVSIRPIIAAPSRQLYAAATSSAAPVTRCTADHVARGRDFRSTPPADCTSTST